MAVQNVIGDSFRGATWVAIHNGGGVGWYAPFSHIHEDCYQVFPSLNTHANGEEFLYRAAGLNEHRCYRGTLIPGHSSLYFATVHVG